MLARWFTGEPVERHWVPLDDRRRSCRAAVIASEDGRFCAHRGVDLGELREAIEDADDLAEVRGGSTITMQTAKNLFLWPGRSFVRKALELPLALWIDLVLPKRRIMEIYLNIAEWGPNGEFGAEAARAAPSASRPRDLSRRRGRAAGRGAAESRRGASAAGPRPGAAAARGHRAGRAPPARAGSRLPASRAACGKAGQCLQRIKRPQML